MKFDPRPKQSDYYQLDPTAKKATRKE